MGIPRLQTRDQAAITFGEGYLAQVGRVASHVDGRDVGIPGVAF